MAGLLPPTNRELGEFIDDQLDNISGHANTALESIFDDALDVDMLEKLDLATDHLRSMNVSLTQVPSQRQNAKSRLATFLLADNNILD